MTNQLFRVKPFNQLQAEAKNDTHGFKRALSATNLIMLGIGAIIGAGIFSAWVTRIGRIMTHSSICY